MIFSAFEYTRQFFKSFVFTIVFFFFLDHLVHCPIPLLCDDHPTGEGGDPGGGG